MNPLNLTFFDLPMLSTATVDGCYVHFGLSHSGGGDSFECYMTGPIHDTGTLSSARGWDGAWAAARSFFGNPFGDDLESYTLIPGNGGEGFDGGWVGVWPTTTPTPAFSALPTYVYAGGTVSFYDSSSQFPTQWQWDFDSNGTWDAFTQQPTYVYNGTGTYSVSLVATNRFGGGTLLADDYVTVVPSPPGGYAFDGTDFTRFTGGTATPHPTEYTLSAWVYVNNTSATRTMVVRSNGNPTTAASHYMQQQGGVNPKWQAVTYDGAPKTTVGTTIIQSGRWYHVVATAKNSGVQRIYVNGVEEGFPVAIGTLWALGNDWWIGRNVSVGTGFEGRMCDVAVWSKELTPAQIYSLASGVRDVPLTIEPSSLILYCPMDDLANGIAATADWTEDVGGLTQTRTSAVVGSTPALLPARPTVDFIAVPTESEDGSLTVDFTDQTSLPQFPIRWFWDFRGNNSIDSRARNPQGVEILGNGTYDVKLTVDTLIGGTGTLVKYDYLKVTGGEDPVVGSDPSFWYEADKILGIANGGTIPLWDDASAYNLDLTEGNASQMPVLKYNMLQGYPSVLFDGVNDRMQNTSVAQTQPNTTFLVYRMDSPDAVYPFIFDGTSATNRQALLADIAQTPDSMYLFAGAAASGVITQPKGIWQVGAITWNGANTKVWQNGVRLPWSPSPGTGNLSGLRVGVDALTAGYWFKGHLAALIGWNRLLTDSEIEEVSFDRMTKYGIGVVTPSNLLSATTPYLWLEADALTGLSDGGAVTTWTDLSTNAFNPTQGAAAARPRYVTDVIRGKPAVRFGGSQYLQTAATFNCTQPMTYLVVGSQVGTANTERFFDIADNNHRQFLAGKQTGSYILYAFNTIITSPYASPATGFHCWLGVLNGANSKMYRDFNLAVAGTVGAGGAASKSLVVGCGWFTVPQQFLTGDIALLVAWNRLLTDDEIALVRSYVMAKYRIR